MPLEWDETERIARVICYFGKTEYFCKRGLTANQWTTWSDPNRIDLVRRYVRRLISSFPIWLYSILKERIGAAQIGADGFLTKTKETAFLGRNNGPLEPSGQREQLEITMLFWLTAVAGFVVLASVTGAGFYFRLNQNLVRGASIVIIMVAVWFSVLAAREDVRKAASLSQSPQAKSI